MSEVRLKENESLESALRRFKKQCARAGVIAEVRKREAFEKPSVKRKKKSEAARKRKYREVQYERRNGQFAVRFLFRVGCGRPALNCPLSVFNCSLSNIGTI